MATEYPFSSGETVGSRLLKSYAEYQKYNPNATRASYMRTAFPGRYSNDASADRAFRKFTRGETSGKRLRGRFNPKDVTRIGRPETPSELGWWKADVLFWNGDPSNPEPCISPETGKQCGWGFTMHSSEYFYRDDAPVVQAIAEGVAESQSYRAGESGSSCTAMCSFSTITVRRVNQSQLTRARYVDLDELTGVPEYGTFDDYDDDDEFDIDY